MIHLVSPLDYRLQKKPVAVIIFWYVNPLLIAALKEMDLKLTSMESRAMQAFHTDSIP